MRVAVLAFLERPSALTYTLACLVRPAGVGWGACLDGSRTSLSLWRHVWRRTTTLRCNTRLWGRWHGEIAWCLPEIGPLSLTWNGDIRLVPLILCSPVYSTMTECTLRIRENHGGCYRSGARVMGGAFRSVGEIKEDMKP